jgi:hypothetical protein
MALGWGGLYYVITQTSPSGGTRWLFFFTVTVGMAGTVLPFLGWINHQFAAAPPPTLFTTVRQAIWVGLYFATLLWLQLGRVLTTPLALLLAAGLILIEWLLRLRERGQWKPGHEKAET